MTENDKKISFRRVLEVIKELLGWRFFPFITAIWILACYYLGLDLVGIYFVCIVGIAMVLTLKDLTPVVPHILFFNVLVSCKNSPLNFGDVVGSTFYTQTAVIAQIAVLVVLLIAAIIARLVITGKKAKFTPNATFWSICALAFAFLLNGFGSENYTIKNLLYAAVFGAILLVIFVLIKSNSSLTEENFKTIAWGFVAFSALLVFELAMKYITDFDKVFVDGHIEKTGFLMGWGVWNNLGAYISMCIPPVCILAAKYKHGYVFLLYAAALVACAFLSGSRQSMLGSSFAFAVSGIALIIKSRARLIISIIIEVILAAVIIVLIVKWDAILSILDRLLSNIFDDNGNYLGNGRMRLIKLALDYFKANPLCGSGFYSEFESFELTGMTGNLIPTFAHNTIMEILGTCGVFGIGAYVCHRVVTVIDFLKQPTQNKYFIAMSLATLLFICLFDNYIFYILPTMAYAALLPFATGKPQ